MDAAMDAAVVGGGGWRRWVAAGTATVLCARVAAAQATFVSGATLLERLEASGNDLNHAVGFVVGVASGAERQAVADGED